jgi:hypothetical protein
MIFLPSVSWKKKTRPVVWSPGATGMDFSLSGSGEGSTEGKADRYLFLGMDSLTIRGIADLSWTGLRVWLRTGVGALSLRHIAGKPTVGAISPCVLLFYSCKETVRISQRLQSRAKWGGG